MSKVETLSTVRNEKRKAIDEAKVIDAVFSIRSSFKTSRWIASHRVTITSHRRCGFQETKQQKTKQRATFAFRKTKSIFSSRKIQRSFIFFLLFYNSVSLVIVALTSSDLFQNALATC